MRNIIYANIILAIMWLTHFRKFRRTDAYFLTSNTIVSIWDILYVVYIFPTDEIQRLYIPQNYRYNTELRGWNTRGSQAARYWDRKKRCIKIYQLSMSKKKQRERERELRSGVHRYPRSSYHHPAGPCRGSWKLFRTPYARDSAV